MSIAGRIRWKVAEADAHRGCTYEQCLRGIRPGRSFRQNHVFTTLHARELGAKFAHHSSAFAQKPQGWRLARTRRLRKRQQRIEGALTMKLANPLEMLLMLRVGDLGRQSVETWTRRVIRALEDLERLLASGQQIATNARFGVGKRDEQRHNLSLDPESVRHRILSVARPVYRNRDEADEHQQRNQWNGDDGDSFPPERQIRPAHTRSFGRNSSEYIGKIRTNRPPGREIRGETYPPRVIVRTCVSASVYSQCRVMNLWRPRRLASEHAIPGR